MSVYDAIKWANVRVTVARKRGYGFVIYSGKGRLCERINNLRKSKEFVNGIKLWHALDAIGYEWDDTIFTDVACGQNWQTVVRQFHKTHKHLLKQ